MRSIILNQEMVRAYAEGRKDVTRVPMKMQPGPETTFYGTLITPDGDPSFWPCSGDPKDFETWGIHGEPIFAPLTPGEAK